MSKIDDLLNDIDKRQHSQVTDRNDIPNDAVFQGDSDGDGNMEWAADTDGDGFLDTIYELVTGLF